MIVCRLGENSSQSHKLQHLRIYLFCFFTFCFALSCTLLLFIFFFTNNNHRFVCVCVCFVFLLSFIIYYFVLSSCVNLTLFLLAWFITSERTAAALFHYLTSLKYICTTNNIYIYMSTYTKHIIHLIVRNKNDEHIWL